MAMAEIGVQIELPIIIHSVRKVQSPPGSRLTFKVGYWARGMETALPVVAFVPACTRNGCGGGASSLALVPAFPFPSPISVRTFSSRRGQLQLQSRRFGSLRPVIVSAAENPTSTSAERWLLEPIGDGDCKHIGFRIPLPNSFELASNTVTVGRVPEKADLVIPIATVSGLHARLEKKAGFLLVTDLDSTNGTFIDDKKLRPGVVATVSPGSSITFGDAHLAAFRFSRLENVDPPSEPGKSKVDIENAMPPDNLKTSS